MLSVDQISKTYGIETILDNVSFNINEEDRIGLVGPNGCGKTTLLRILAGEELQDSGTVTLNDPDLRIGYLPQGYEFDQNLTLGEILSSRFNRYHNLEAELENLASEIATDPNNKLLQHEYDLVLQRLEHKPTIHPRSLIEVLGLGEIADDQSVKNLSGGQKTRLSLAFVIMNDPDVLFLDEPTNHLDIDMLEWLENWISGFPGAVLLVSHDRTFLDRTVSRILDLDPSTHSIREYTGNYSDYIVKYLSDREKQLQEYRNQEYEIRRMKQDIARTKSQAYRVELTTTSREPGVRRYAKKVAKKAKSREKKLKRFLDSDDRVEKPEQSWQMKLEFDDSSIQSQKVISLEDVSIGYQGCDPLVRDLEFIIKAGERIVLTGPNGGGKTTLLRTLAGQLKPLTGKVKIGPSIRLGYMTQEQESLPAELSPVEIIQRVASIGETEVRSFLHYFLFSGDDSLRPVRSLSFGERSRLALAFLVAQGSNMLLMDEPINHLDIPSREHFERSLSRFNGTILAVIHDRYFIERFATKVWILKAGRMTQLPPNKMLQNRLS